LRSLGFGGRTVRQRRYPATYASCTSVRWRVSRQSRGLSVGRLGGTRLGMVVKSNFERWTVDLLQLDRVVGGPQLSPELAEVA
jgi:hypothetical protein